jgi:GNAT superfamily N-acetyltransferase
VRNVELRRGVPADAPALAEVLIEAWQTAFRGSLPDQTLSRMSLPDHTARFERIIAEPPPVEVWVAVQGSAVVGYGTIGPERAVGSAPELCELRALYLRSSIWRLGVGRGLHDHLLARMAATKFDQAMLWVFGFNERARAFYESLGWSGTEQTNEIQLGDELHVAYRYERALA